MKSPIEQEVLRLLDFYTSQVIVKIKIAQDTFQSSAKTKDDIKALQVSFRNRIYDLEAMNESALSLLGGLFNDAYRALEAKDFEPEKAR